MPWVPSEYSTVDRCPAWLITQHLLAKIAVGAVIVMDNVNIHKRPDMLELTRAKPCWPSFFQPTAKAIRRQYWCGVDEFFSAHSHNMSFYNDLAILPSPLSEQLMARSERADSNRMRKKVD